MLGGGFLSGYHAGPRGLFAGSLVSGLALGGGRAAFDSLAAEDLDRLLPSHSRSRK